MGVSTDAILAFGFDLGEELPESWEQFRDDEEDEFEFDNLIAKEAGLDDFDWDSSTTAEQSSYLAKISAARDAYKVELIYHCSYDYPSYFLAVPDTEVRARRGHPAEVFKEDKSFDVSAEKIQALKDFCNKYEISWQEPRWRIFSMWG